VTVSFLGLALVLAGVLALWRGRLHKRALGSGTAGAPLELVGESAAAAGTSEGSLSGASAVGKLFQRNGSMMYAQNVCISRHFDCRTEFFDCNKHAFKHPYLKVSLKNTFSKFMRVRRAGPDEQKLPGATLLFSVAHLGRYFRWNNIAHFSKRAYPLEDYLEQYGRDELKQVVVWEAAKDQLLGTNDGFKTDWYEQLMALTLPLAAAEDHRRLVYGCDDVPRRKAGASSSGSEAPICFEKLVAFEETPARFRDPPFFRHVASCASFRSRALRYLHLDPQPSLRSVGGSVAALIRTDPQGWHNYPEMVRKMGEYVQGRGGDLRAVYLNTSKMTLREQVSWFNHAGVIVTTHGAQEANIAFAQQGATVIEYFKKNHYTYVFSNIAVACGVNYIAVHAENTTRCWTRKWMNSPQPADFEAELKPALEVAMDRAKNASAPHCPYAHHFVGGGVDCYSDWKDFRQRWCRRHAHR